MAWISTIKSIDKVQGGISIVVSYANGDEVIEKQINSSSSVDMAWVKRQIKNDISTMDSLYALADSITLGVIDPTETPQDTRTQSQKDEDVWIRKYNKWVKIKQTLVDTGVKPINDPDFAPLLLEVQTSYKKAYLNDI